jgi:hypothetical protein
MGTPSYMSPEQGAGTRIDKRSDLYSLGIILFELLTGHVPYTAETPLAVVFKHIQDPLPSVRKYCPNLSTEMEMVLYKALAKSPDDRYQTAEDFVRAIQQVDIAEELPLETTPTRESKPTQAQSSPAPAAPPVAAGPTGAQFKSTPPATPSTGKPEPRPSYPPRTQPPAAPKPGNYWGALAALGGVILCVILAGVVLLGLGVLSSGSLPTEQATSTPSTEGLSTATVGAQTETAAEAEANATATDTALHANATAVWKQATYNDTFKDNSGQWATFSLNANSEYWVGVASIVDGVYQFKINQTKKPFIYWIAFKGETSNDFDLSVSTRRLGGTPDQACYGVYFRNMGEKKYVFNVCDNQTYLIEYYDGSKYNRLREWTQTPAIKPNAWNALWVSARGDTFTFYINEIKIETIKHNILPSGTAGLLFEVFNKDAPTFQFDNFAYLKR